MKNAWLIVATGLVSAGCGAILGFEDHEPFPPGTGGASSSVSSSVSSAGGTSSSVVSSSATGGAGGGGGGEVELTPVLLIPDTVTESVGKYDPTTGTYIGDFIPPLSITDPYTLDFPIDVVQGPDGFIYLADQFTNEILRFAADGTFDRVFASDLEGVRGIDFKDGDLLASVSSISGGHYVARFGLDGMQKANFLSDTSEPHDLLFLPAGTFMMADDGDTDQVRLYDIDAMQFTSLLQVPAPLQVKALSGGNYVVCGSSNAVEFTGGGSIVNTVGVSGGGGVHELPDGTWLVTTVNGIQRLEPSNGNLLETVRVGGDYWKIEPANLP